MIIANHQVFLIIARGTARPIETAGQQYVVVKNGKLMMHVIGDLICGNRNTGRRQFAHVGAGIVLLQIVRYHPNPASALMGIEDILLDSVVGYRKDTNIDGGSGRCKSLGNSGKAILAGTKVCGCNLGIIGVLRPVNPLNEHFQPFQNLASLPASQLPFRNIKGPIPEKRKLFGIVPNRIENSL